MRAENNIRPLGRSECRLDRTASASAVPSRHGGKVDKGRSLPARTGCSWLSPSGLDDDGQWSLGVAPHQPPLEKSDGISIALLFIAAIRPSQRQPVAAPASC